MSKKDPDAAILEYLEQHNRPYSAVDVFTNMHKEIGKTAVVKGLESLSEKEKIVEKTYGKQKVYAPRQDVYGDHNEEDLKAYDVKNKEIQERLTSMQKDLKTQEGEIQMCNRQLTNEEVTKNIQELQRSIDHSRQKIKKFKSGCELVTKEQRTKIYARRDNMISHWKKRKRMANEILGCILESYPKTKKELYEDVGIETDEEAGVKVPNTK